MNVKCPKCKSSDSVIPIMYGYPSTKPWKKHNRPHADLHSLRHTFNQSLLDLGMGIEDKQKLLAHASSDTTKLYTHPNFDLASQFVNKIPMYGTKVID